MGMAGDGAGAEGGEPGGGAGGEAGSGGTLSGGSGGLKGSGGKGQSGNAGVTGAGGVTTGGIGNNGGTSNTGGTSSGGTGNTGGKATTGGAGNTGGKATTGGTSTGGTTGGTSGGAGKGGSSTGGTLATGGVVSSGGTGGTCTPVGAEVCTDGKDNDCNGHVDCLTFSSVFPEPNGAAAGKDVQLIANAPALTGYTFECRSARGQTVPDNVPWAACQTGANLRIVPRTAAESQLASNDGLWTTQVRAVFPGGATTDPFSHTYYMHSSLHISTRCNPRATDAAFISAGKAYLNDAGAFGTASVLRSPFIQLSFTPPVSTRFNVVAGNGVVKLMSLRRRFTRSSDDKYLLMTRNYASSRSNVCTAIALRTHDTTLVPYNPNIQYFDRCDALLFNKAGSGVCMYVDVNNVIQVVKHVNPYTPAGTYSASADNFAWRKLLDRNSKRDGLVHFTPKCFTTGCATSSNFNYFLPDKAQFPYY